MSGHIAQNISSIFWVDLATILSVPRPEEDEAKYWNILLKYIWVSIWPAEVQIQMQMKLCGRDLEAPNISNQSRELASHS